MSWLEGEWARGLGKVAFASILLWFLKYYLEAIGVSNPLGFVGGCDFLNFWGAGKAALLGVATGAYDEAVMWGIQKSGLPGTLYYPYMYAPVFMALFAPFALLSYESALLLWVALTFPAYLFAARQLLPGKGALWWLAAFPAVLINAGHGQTAFLIFAILCLGFALLPTQPFLAGMILGLMLMKPHLAILLPVAMLASRNWKAVAGAAVSVLTLLVCGLLLFGPETYQGYLKTFGMGRRVLAGEVPYYVMSSLYASIRMMGGAPTLALAVQFTATAVSGAITWRIWRSIDDWRTRAAAFMPCALLATPYAYNYDLLLLMFPIAWLATRNFSHPSRLEIGVLAVCFWLPLMARPIAENLGFLVTPFIVAACLMIVSRKLITERRTSELLEPPLRAA